MATVSRLDKIIGLFCKRALQKRQYSAEETCGFIDPTDRSHPICILFACVYVTRQLYLVGVYVCDRAEHALVHVHVYLCKCMCVCVCECARV